MHGDEYLTTVLEQSHLCAGKNHTCVYTAASLAPNVNLLQTQDVTIYGLQFCYHLQQPAKGFVDEEGCFVTEERSGDELLVKVRGVQGLKFSSRRQYSHLFQFISSLDIPLHIISKLRRYFGTC